MAHLLTWEPKRVYARFFSECAVDDVMKAFEKISGDARSDDIRGAIFDYLDVERQNMTESEIEMVAAFDIGLAYSLPLLRIASVTADEHMLELLRHFVAVVEMPGRHGVFSTVSVARDWLAECQPTPSFPQSRRLLYNTDYCAMQEKPRIPNAAAVTIPRQVSLAASRA